MADVLPRRLIWVPVIHTPEDLGSIQQPVREAYLKQHGQSQWDRRVRTVADMWRRIARRIDELDLSYANVKLYQDGLPICDHEAQIVSDLAEGGSLNHQLLRELMKRGATLVGTESPELLIQEYTLARQILLGTKEDGSRAPSPSRVESRSREILDKRDRFIAERIAQTLQRGETGLLFLGMLHSINGRLPADVEVTQLNGISPILEAPEERR
ncbi:MAG: hypothetical protein P4L84_27785 [Isosphaeraceae bacterium]|nr:hypothetical protein [Isosphaeraceae bacterium]